MGGKTPVFINLIFIMNKNLLKSLVRGQKRKSGRNVYGRITVRRRGGGHKRLYRKLNFNYLSKLYKVLSDNYTPFSNNKIQIVKCFYSGKLDYIPAIKDVNEGDIVDYKKGTVVIGGRYKLKDIPSNYLISNVEIKEKKGGQIARSSGVFCKILQKDYDKSLVRLKLPSLEERYVNMNCFATVGSIFNNLIHTKKLNKAGNSRWRGRRPKVRGVAMNPVDHPHGGGEGKTSGGRCSVTPWGRITHGKFTRSKKKYTNSLIFKKRNQF